jgi:hypothetical protein
MPRLRGRQASDSPIFRETAAIVDGNPVDWQSRLARLRVDLRPLDPRWGTNAKRRGSDLSRLWDCRFMAILPDLTRGLARPATQGADCRRKRRKSRKMAASRLLQGRFALLE